MVQVGDYGRAEALMKRVGQRCNLCPLMLDKHFESWQYKERTGGDLSMSVTPLNTRKRKRKSKGDTNVLSVQEPISPHKNVVGFTSSVALRELQIVMLYAYGDDISYMMMKHAAYVFQHNPVWTSRNEEHTTMSNPPPPLFGAPYGWGEVGTSGPYTSFCGVFPGEATITIGDYEGRWLCGHAIPRVTLITQAEGVRVNQSWYPRYPVGAYVYRVRMECKRSCARAFYALRAVSLGQSYVSFVVQKNVSMFARKLKQDTGFSVVASKAEHFRKAVEWVKRAQAEEEDLLGARGVKSSCGTLIRSAPNPWEARY